MVQQLLAFDGVAKLARQEAAREVVRSAYRTHLWQPFHLRPPLAGCGPLHHGNDNPYWPAAVSEHRRWQFEVGQWQAAWMDTWVKAAGYREEEQ